MEAQTPCPCEPFPFTDLAGMLAEPPAPAWLIRGYLETDSLAVLYGPSGVMKTFIALDMAICIAAGLPWHGIATHNHGPCFYIAGEGQRGLRKRLKVLAIKYSLIPSNVRLFTANQPVFMLDKNSTFAMETELSRLADTNGTPRLVIIDTLNRCFGLGDENRTDDMTAFVDAINAIRIRFGCTVLVVHHSGHKKQERSRGSSALHNAVDFEYRIAEKGKSKVLECTKVKDHEEFATIVLQPEQVSTGWIDPETGEEATSCVLKRVSAIVSKQKPLSGALAVAHEALKVACGAEGRASEKAWRDVAYQKGISTSEKADSKRQAFVRAVGVLVAQGYAEADTEPGVYRLSRHRDANGDIGKATQTSSQDQDITGTSQAQHDQTDKTPPP